MEVSALPGMHRLDYKTNEKTTRILNRWWEMCFESAYPSGMMVGHIDGAWKLIDEGMGYALSFLPEKLADFIKYTESLAASFSSSSAYF